MVNALVAIEDSRYWVHGAIDLRGTIRAAVNDIQHKPVQGGSTIAQQYVKNVLLLQAEVANNTQAVQAADAETLSRKLNELRMAVAAEHQQSKQDILAGYLNDAYFGNNAYGIETAAETYFGTSAAKLSVTQAATLAGIVENPTRLRPDPAPRDGPPAAQYRAGPDGPDQQRAYRGAGHGRRGQAAWPAVSRCPRAAASPVRWARPASSASTWRRSSCTTRPTARRRWPGPSCWPPAA